MRIQGIFNFIVYRLGQVRLQPGSCVGEKAPQKACRNMQIGLFRIRNPAK